MNSTIGNAESAFAGTSDYLFIIAIAAFALSGLVIFARNIVTLMTSIPILLIESVLYAVCGTLIYLAPSFTNHFSHIVSMPPAIFVSALMAYDVTRIFKSNRNRCRSYGRGTLYSSIIFGLNVILFGGLAVYLDSLSMGYVCIACLMGLIGFNVGFGPGVIAVGYRNKDVIPSATFASLCVLLIGTYFKVAKPIIMWQYTTLEGYPGALFLDCFIQTLFVPPMLWFGSFVYFISLLIVSSRYYAETFDQSRAKKIYVQMQLVAIASGLAAIYFGIFYEIPQLYGIAGTVVSFYFIEKAYELSSKGMGIYLVFIGSLAVILLNTYIRSLLIEYGYDQMFQTYFHFYPRPT